MAPQDWQLYANELESWASECASCEAKSIAGAFQLSDDGTYSVSLVATFSYGTVAGSGSHTEVNQAAAAARQDFERRQEAPSKRGWPR